MSMMYLRLVVCVSVCVMVHGSSHGTHVTTQTISYVNSCCNIYDFPANGCDFRQSLKAGAPTTPSLGSGSVVWVTGPSTPPGALHPCSNQGVLKIRPPSGTKQVHIYLGICNPRRFSFNLGDSPTNNGYGGDSSSTPSKGWAAEIHNVNQNMLIYENVAWKHYSPPVAVNQMFDYFNEYGSTTWHLEVNECDQLKMENIPSTHGTEFLMRNDHMFKWGDDWYLGLNRVVHGPGERFGQGVCEVCIKFDRQPITGTCNPSGYKYCNSCDRRSGSNYVFTAARRSPSDEDDSGRAEAAFDL